MRYPNQIKQRRQIDALTGIKSSLDHIRSVIALIYLLYVANERKSFVRYSISDGAHIKMDPILLASIEKLMGKGNLETVVNNNPLLTKQYEPLYVGITLLMKLGHLKMDGKQSTAERTGGIRYPKQLYFANNIIVLDLILNGFPDEVRYEALFEWLQNKKSSNRDFEERVCMFLTTCTIFTQFKLRDNTNKELFFQTEGIYSAIKESDDEVLYADSHEFVGPTRIYNNVLGEELEPWVDINRSVLGFKDKKNPDAKSISDMISTPLNIFSVKNDAAVIDNDFEVDDLAEAPANTLGNNTLQQIYYGAPGTGKSHEIKKKTKGEAVIRTTFHPDSDYSTFVGAYKPTMDDVDAKVVPVILGESGTVFNKNEGTYKEKRIVYQFVMQAFLKAYLGAWKKYAEADGNEVNPQFLVIEEINRGNCAQIFGDLFQLLDRGDNGFSEYPIEADNDLQREIERAFIEHKDYKLKEGVKINVEGAVKDYTSNYGATLSEDIQSGRVLLLPSNLFIWATMNTSDQSLFPIDSAFKRRWDWRYIPIAQGKNEDGTEKKWEIEGQGENSWWTFIQGINEVIDVTTHSEDKKLGFFFCKAQDGVVKKETFVNKVVFYLWNDVFKVYGFKSVIFDMKGKDDKTEKITFKSFYNEDGSVNEETMSVFVKNVMAKAPKGSTDSENLDVNEEQSGDDETQA